MANALTAFNPTLWSRTGIDILREKIVMPKLVRQDFSTDLANAGDTVNTRKPAKMTSGTVTQGVALTAQDVSATNVAVVLNQHKHTTFLIYDIEASKSFKNLVDEYIDPAMLALANTIDISLLGLYTDISKIITCASAGAWKTGFSDARRWLNKQLAKSANRYAVLGDDSEADLANLDLLTQAYARGDTQGITEGGIGRFKGFDVFRASNVIGVGSPVINKNLFFHKDAFALVLRPLTPAAGQTPGAIQTVVTDPDAGLALRMTMWYNASLLATQTTFDILYGVKTLDQATAVVVNGN